MDSIEADAYTLLAERICAKYEGGCGGACPADVIKRAEGTLRRLESDATRLRRILHRLQTYTVEDAGYRRDGITGTEWVKND
jgi:hypothetical protein